MTGRRTMGRRSLGEDACAQSKSVCIPLPTRGWQLLLPRTRYSGMFAVSIRMDGDDWLVHFEVPPDMEADSLQDEFLRAPLDEQLRERMRSMDAAAGEMALFMAGCDNNEPDCKVRCSEIMEDGKVLATGYVIDASQSHIAIFDPATRRTTVMETSGKTITGKASVLPDD
ncbi:hypothetical protein ACFONC_10115 [Luteimonas soli]|uniref:Uncharacterized protein n=1 Tax=Luteimonas soli TaxID=1648966 RepID=A0ABV7XL46_9GAMM